MDNWISFVIQKPEEGKKVEFRYYQYGLVKDAVGYWDGKTKHMCGSKRNIAEVIQWREIKDA
jgi:hypothetical protein